MSLRGLRYADLSTDYYLMGRASILNYRVNISGNLFHHSIEMMLKGIVLMNTPSPEEYDSMEKEFKHKIVHNLDKLWNIFKSKHPKNNPEGYDGIITKLNNWEEVRYPSKKSVTKIAGPTKNSVVFDSSMKTELLLECSLEEMDDLFNFLWTNYIETPSYKFKDTLILTKDLYEKNNKFPIYQIKNS